MASSTFPSSRDASHLSQQLRCASTSSSSSKHRRVLTSSSKAVRCKLLHKLGITPKSTTHQHNPTTRTSREYLRNVPRYKQPLKYTHDHRCRRLSLEDREEEREPTTSSRRSSTTQYRSSTSSSPQRVILSDNDIEKLRNEISTLFLDDDERRQHPSPTHRRQSSPKCVSSFPMMEESDSKKKKRRSVGFQETVTVVPIPMRNEYSDRIKVKIWGDKVQTIEALERNILEYASEDYNWRNVCLEEEMYTCSTSQELIHPVHLESGLYTFGTGERCQRSYRYEC